MDPVTAEEIRSDPRPVRIRLSSPDELSEVLVSYRDIPFEEYQVVVVILEPRVVVVRFADETLKVIHHMGAVRRDMLWPAPDDPHYSLRLGS